MSTITIFGQGAGTYNYDPDYEGGGLAGSVAEGGEGNDLVVGGQGSSIVEGGAGNDILIGGSLKEGGKGQAGTYHITGSGERDTFAFNFELRRVEGETFYFRPNADGTSGDTPNSNANVQAWENYLSQLADWREAMEALYGTDAESAATGTAIATVKKQAIPLGSYDNSFTVAGSLEITASDGFDTILDFGAEDKLALRGLKGITFEDFDTLFNVTSTGKATTLAWDSGSITIHGLDLADDVAFYVAATAGDWFI